jgi:hypothetical protein
MFVQWTNRFWATSLDFNFFLNFLKLFGNMHLAISFAGVQISYFSNLRIKSYGCLKILGKVWAGRECAAANKEELTTCAKIWGQEVGRRG